MARDIRNVKRGNCNSCKSCTNYLSLSGKVLCDYCGCPPAKHERLDEDPDEEAPKPTHSNSDPDLDTDPDPSEDPEKATSSPIALRRSTRRSGVPIDAEGLIFEKKKRKTLFEILLDKVAKRRSSRLSYLLDLPPPNADIQKKNAWNPQDRSYNIIVKDDDFCTAHRQPVAQSTDAIRGKIGYERGVHLFEFTWPLQERGTHACVGVCTSNAPVHCVGYQGLVGNSKHSWGWDLGRLKAFHNSKNLLGKSYPEGLKPEHKFTVPDKFSLVIDMDEGVAGFVINGRYLGHAFKGLRGKKTVCDNICSLGSL